MRGLTAVARASACLDEARRAEADGPACAPSRSAYTAGRVCVSAGRGVARRYA
jgi:hypothetical protein